MRTMYRVDMRMTDAYGHNGHEVEGTEYYNTHAEAKEWATNNIKKDVVVTGDWKVVARTINEEAFTVVDEVVEEYDWYEEVGKYEWIEEDIYYAKKNIKEFTFNMKRCKKEETINKWKKEIKRWEETLDKLYSFFYYFPLQIFY